MGTIYCCDFCEFIKINNNILIFQDIKFLLILIYWSMVNLKITDFEHENKRSVIKM